MQVRFIEAILFILLYLAMLYYILLLLFDKDTLASLTNQSAGQLAFQTLLHKALSRSS